MRAKTARKKDGCTAFANDDLENARRVKYYWEIIADNLSKARLDLGLCISVGFQRANGLDCRRTSQRRKAFRCACG
jgi:hypothetical protein